MTTWPENLVDTTGELDALDRKALEGLEKMLQGDCDSFGEADEDKARLIAIRARLGMKYWYHPESESVFAAYDGSGDGHAHELTVDEYYALKEVSDAAG